jgi:hypothetical protein
MRFFRRRDQPSEEDRARVALVVLVAAITPVFAFLLDWRLGLFIFAAYAALGFGVWRVSRQRRP